MIRDNMTATTEEQKAMATVTLEVPEELAAKLEQFRPHLPALLNEILNGGIGEKVLVDIGVVPSRQVFDEMIGFLACGPTREQIIAYKISDAAQTRLRELLDKNREDGLTEVESAELDVFQSVDYLMAALMAKSRSLLRTNV
jgi:hypothetical protein